MIVAGLGWRWVFLLNAPLAAVLALAAARLLPRLERTADRGRSDWLAAILSSAAVAALALAVIGGQNHGWTSVPVLAAFAAGAAALGGFIGWERKQAEPLVDLSLFGRPAFTAANLAAFVVFFAFVGGIVYFSAYFQQVQGRSPIVAGLDVAAIGVAYALAATASGRLVGRVGERAPLITGLVISGAAMLGLLRLQPGTGIGAIWWNFRPPRTRHRVVRDADEHDRDVGRADRPRRDGLGRAQRAAPGRAGLRRRGAGRARLRPAARGQPGQRLDPARAAQFIIGLHQALWVSGLALIGSALTVAALLIRPAR